LTAVSGLGWGWLGPNLLHVPADVRELPTPSVALGTLFANVGPHFGIHASPHTVVTVTQWLCAAAAALVVVWLALHVRRTQDVRLLGIGLAVVVLASPTVWPWYLLWGLTLLSVTRAQRSRALALAAGLAMAMVGPSGRPVLQGEAYLAVVAACMAGVLWLVRDRRWVTVALGPVA
jgi:hypothetical protein